MPLTTSVTVSSAVGLIAYSWSARSRRRNMPGPIDSQRPLCFQSSAGCRIGITISCAPARFISSRTICCTLFSARMPSGRYV